VGGLGYIFAVLARRKAVARNDASFRYRGRKAVARNGAVSAVSAHGMEAVAKDLKTLWPHFQKIDRIRPATLRAAAGSAGARARGGCH
jgi:hypothetical protein